MTTPTISPTPAASKAAVDRGLRSVQGIRWLLLAGGLMVAVSVIRLVAAEWGALPTAARFLTLAAGALAVFAAGDVTRRRLCLPVAGSALLYLGTTLVPAICACSKHRSAGPAWAWAWERCSQPPTVRCAA